MRKHNGMRPQDVAILLKMITEEEKEWLLSDLANSLFISLSEVSESLNRSKLGGLIDYHKKRVNRQNLMEFMEHGLRYVFPRQPGGIARGIPTAHSHPFMKKMFAGSEIEYVWPDINGEMLGLIVEPFYPKQTEAVKRDEQFYKLLALSDVLRLGRIREINYALIELKKIILHEPSYK